MMMMQQNTSQLTFDFLSVFFQVSAANDLLKKKNNKQDRFSKDPLLSSAAFSECVILCFYNDERTVSRELLLR